jgi:flagellar hook-basal body complex protein FliE
MAVSPIVPVTTPIPSAPVAELRSAGSAQQADGPNGASFGDLLSNAVGKLNASLNQADELAMRLAAGDDVDVHQVMIAMESASIGLQTAIQVRNKAVDAYREIMAMPV